MRASNIEERLRTLRQDYLARLPGKLDETLTLWHEWLSAQPLKDVPVELRALVHNLAGTGALFGVPEISEAAQEVEALFSLHEKHALESTPNFEVRTLSAILVLQRAIEFAVAINSKSASLLGQEDLPKELHHGLPSNRIYIVDDDTDFSQMLAAKLAEHGYRAPVFASSGALLATVEHALPAAIIMDMALPEGRLADANVALRTLSKNYPSIPVMFVSVCDDLESRLNAVRAGAVRYFVKPVDFPHMLKSIDEVTLKRPTDTYRLLIVDDDPEIAQMYRLHLEKVGVAVSSLNDSANTLDELEAFKPDLILLDIHMPDISGLEIGAVIRQYEKYRHIPIIYLTSSQGIENRLAAMRLGGDGFITKSLSPWHATEILLAHLARARALKNGELTFQNTLKELELIKHGLDQHAIVSISDAAGNISYANEKFCHISGYSQAELIGQNHRLLKSDFHPAAFFKQMWASVSQGEVWHGLVKNLGKNGHAYWVETTITPILDYLGKPQHYIAMHTDITHLIDLEEELREKEERLRLALEATSTGLWEWNFATQLTYYDKQWRSLLGYDAEANLEALSWPTLIHPGDFQATADALITHLHKESDFYVSEHRKKNIDGGWDWVQESGRVVERDADDIPSRIIGTLQIINKRKALETRNLEMQSQLQQATKMEAIGHLTAGIAHDFNNILGAILGYVELSISLTQRDSPPFDKLQRFLLEVQTAGNRARDLVAQMLTFSRLSSQLQEDATPIVRLQPIIKEVISLLRSSIPTTIKLSYEIEHDDIQAVVQPVHFHQILLNLGINARDAIGEYGEIDVSVSARDNIDGICASCRKEFTGPFIEIKVTDSGSGIPDAILAKVFDPFFTTKEVGKGTGMGLSVVHGAVHALNGHILVSSQPNAGTAISILLPQPHPDQLAEIEQEAKKLLPQQSLEGLKIMVIDDEAAIASMLHELLSMHGASLTSFNDSSEALAAFLQDPSSIDVVITDETMPALSGMHMAEKMLGQRPELPIILCTGFSEHASPETAKRIGLTALLKKPLDIQHLIELLRPFAPSHTP